MYYIGTIKSPFDKRDYIYKISRNNKKISLPAILDYRNFLPSIRNQGSQGTCAAQSAACIKEYQERKNIDYNGHFSPQFIYNNRKSFPVSGMTGRDTMNILKNIGVCREITFPYNDQRVGPNIPETAITEASNNKIKYYATVDFNINDGDKNITTLKTCLVENGPCWIAFPCYNSEPDFWNDKNNTGTSTGHAVCIVGYTDGGFILRNSWGDKFGHNGYCNYSYSDFLQKKHWEIWTCVDDLSSVKLPKTNEICINTRCNII